VVEQVDQFDVFDHSQSSFRRRKGGELPLKSLGPQAGSMSLEAANRERTAIFRRSDRQHQRCRDRQQRAGNHNIEEPPHLIWRAVLVGGLLNGASRKPNPAV